MWSLGYYEQDLDRNAVCTSSSDLSGTVAKFLEEINAEPEMFGDLLIGVGEAVNNMLHSGKGEGYASIGDMDTERVIICCRCTYYS